MHPELGKVTSASLSDAVRRLHGHRAHVLDLVSPTRRVLFGPAVTMAFGPLRSDVDEASVSFVRALDAAMGADGVGAVVVMASYGLPDAAVAGGIRLAHLENRGAAGLLTDGRLRDFAEAHEFKLTAYCRGETPVAGSSESMPIGWDVPVVVGGVTVYPGDFLYCDAAGAVVVPAADVARVVEAAVAIGEKDAQRLAKARAGGA